MAVRAPGSPRRNPLFDVLAEPFPDDEPDADARDARDDGERDGSRPGAEALHAVAGAGDRADDDAGAPTGLVALFEALEAAGPEAAEHLVTAAHELVLAVKVIVDAAERALAEQRASARAE